MNKRIFWQDHVTEFDDRFKEITNDDGTITHQPVEGEVIQQGTPQNAANFNDLEERAWAAGQLAAEAARAIVLHQRELNKLSSVSGVVELSNSQQYPFNNSVKTVALIQQMETTDYTVDVDVVFASGDVGKITVTDKQMNGFKLAYTGSAVSAKLNYAVKGGRF